MGLNIVVKDRGIRMIRLFKTMYQRYVVRNLFVKNTLMFSVISIFPILLLTLYFSNDIALKLQEKETIQTQLITYNLNQYLDEKYDSFYTLIRQTYANKSVSPDFFNFIETDTVETTNTNYTYKNNFINYLNNFLSSDRSLLNVLIYKVVDSSLYVVSKKSGYSYHSSESVSAMYENHLSFKAPTMQINPSRYTFYDDDEIAYSVSINLKILGSNYNSSVLQMDYSPIGFENALNQMGTIENLGSVYIYTPSGEIIYDSTNQYYETIFPFFSELEDGISSRVIEGNDCIISTSRRNKFGLIVTHIIPKALIFKEINALKQKIYLVAIICIIAVILLTHYGTSTLSKRISSITSAMKEVRTGKLDSKIDTRPYGDEINDIAINFNEMCVDLSEYIDKIYVYEIDKKNAEINALQTQINPHFIYNTLEVIRMSATSAGDTRVGQMIFLLAKMFRNIVKDENVVLIDTEIRNIKLYLDLFKIRYNETFSYEIEIASTIGSFGIPKHILQPLVENYVIHGYDLKKDNNHIRLIFKEVDEDILIAIQDNGIGIDDDRLKEVQELLDSDKTMNRTHIGLKNVHDRIQLIYGKQYGITIKSVPFKTTELTLKIAAKTKKEITESYQQGDV